MRANWGNVSWLAPMLVIGLSGCVFDDDVPERGQTTDGIVGSDNPKDPDSDGDTPPQETPTDTPETEPPQETPTDPPETDPPQETPTDTPETDPPQETPTTDPPGEACGPVETPFVAGQHNDVGTVTISNDGETLFVELSLGALATFDTVHIYAGPGPVPTNAGGAVAPGQFPYPYEFDPATGYAVFEISLDEIGGACGETLVVAVHAEVGDETAWAQGPFEFTGSQWGWWLEYEVCCDEEPTDDGCTLTQGYWKNHHAGRSNPSQQIAWPIAEDTELCGATWLDILNTPPRGDAWTILAHQWIAAKLNAASGASTADLDGALDEAGDLLTGHCDGLSGDQAHQALDLSDLLDAYNNGLVGPGHCD